MRIKILSCVREEKNFSLNIWKNGGKWKKKKKRELNCSRVAAYLDIVNDD